MARKKYDMPALLSAYTGASEALSEAALNAGEALRSESFPDDAECLLGAQRAALLAAREATHVALVIAGQLERIERMARMQRGRG